jgi:hypothetical protein
VCKLCNGICGTDNLESIVLLGIARNKSVQ